MRCLLIFSSSRSPFSLLSPHGASSLDSFFFFECYGDHRDLHSFPTRRSSDLRRRAALVRRGFEALDVLQAEGRNALRPAVLDRKSTRLNSSHANISYAVFCLKKKNKYSWRISRLNQLGHAQREIQL